ncbi:MAG: phosphoribosylformylglycinamidine cyclo-ligase [Gammaproteobacteria bacterium]|nr:phosphoribosylformylglycinamidine cyclo-ligase [Gammaproteobacteria bacterium]
MIRQPLTYQAAGVDYTRVDALKVLAQQAARSTAHNAAGSGLSEFAESRGESAYVFEVGGLILAAITECLGTKSLVADAMRAFTGRTHYDTIAQDTVATAVNDLVTVGATPLAVHAYWAAGDSEWHSDAERTAELVRGWKAACDACGAVWGGGETPALSGLVQPGRIDLAASAVGIVRGRDRLTLGAQLAAGDAIVLLESSGIHANGVSLARKLAEQLTEGYRTRLPDGRWFGEAVLDPTILYPPVTERVCAAGIRPKYAVNVTGHGWRKLMRHPDAFTYRIGTVPPVPPVLAFMQREAGMSAQDAYGAFNMGAGFALFVAPDAAERTVQAAAAAGVRAWVAGSVEVGAKRVIIEPLGVEYGAEDLHLRD